MLTFGSLFSGIGGFDLGLERAGMACKWQVEIDPSCWKVLENHWPDVRRYVDVKECGEHNLDPVDVICGGFPCQDLSVAGKRAGLAGERSGLWFEYHRVLSELRPRWVVIENVPGLLSSNRGRDFAVLLRGLAGLGYLPAWRVLDAQYFGVAQRRRRVFIVASLGDGRAAEVLFEREGGERDTPPSREAGEGATGNPTQGAPHSKRVYGADGLAPTLQAMPQGGHQGATEAPYVAVGIGGSDLGYALRAGASHSGDKGDGGVNTSFVAFSAGNSSASYGIGADENVTPPIRSGNSGSNQSPTVAYGLLGETTPKVSEEVMPTLRSGNGNTGEQHQFTAGAFGVRRLTPTECERLQGFPDGWTDGQADTQRYRQLGNAVVVPCSEWIARRIVEVA